MQCTSTIESGVLYVVATPIGNLEDISARALRVLRGVDGIAAEDTRHTSQLLAHFGIDTPLFSLHEHNEYARLEQIVRRLRQGQSLALVSDAGTPLISDPGFPLVRALRQQGLNVIPVPGPSSILAALSVAGLPTDRFIFEGFLPAKSAARCQRLRVLAGEERTLVFLEASHRITDMLADLVAVFGGVRSAVIARELTKRFEEVQGAALSELLVWLDADPNRRRGEFVVLVQGASPMINEVDTPEIRRLLTALMEALPLGRAVAVAVKATGLKRKALYELALRLGKVLEPVRPSLD
ncbi:MAG TPA: 16S rRNA (cytidine(1402)-2'-O)-methyltransferase [Candidatus Competibacteraceae bacterium]|nr:16S rRNA (cytidine(1402)-2'-O)-methyltransferase [Candidatus Competibacteraceae bacterium]MCP5132645.1 16S rRNA (cytidine(1402)-2'-O)-methyltransferase [Gammaproteobacteria bacterium]HPF58535.1 16S rRNA (cytidine(1402)-2'-O)-methyltransferase [Candidatus Competibacteraceae bacterium]HRY17031.1 16S rRNA (cytidine(1402)-2'-O)-methyltransferase [Candidatus Competibacteraceae bacterium]